MNKLKKQQEQAFNEFINHLMQNKGTCCYAPSKRYCAVGKNLKDQYLKLCKQGEHDDFRQSRNKPFK